MLVEKEIVRPGSYFYVDEKSGLPRRLDVTPESIDYWHTSGQKMLAAGLSVPVPFEHQPEAKPLSATEKAAKQLKDNAGWVTGYAKKKIKDGDKEVDALFGMLDITDPDVAKKLPQTIRWTSPWFSSFTAGDGQNYEGVIGHLALTSRPRIVKQQPFANTTAALSLAVPAIPQGIAFKPGACDGIGLSRAGLLANGLPRYPVAFSLWAGTVKPRIATVLNAVKLAIEDMKAKEKPKPDTEGVTPPAKEKPGEPPAKPEGGEKPPMGHEDPNAVLQPIEEALVDPDGDISVHDVLCDLLETVDIVLEEGDAENFEERLYKALMEKMKANKGATDPMATEPKPPANPANPTPPAQPKVETPPIYMSANLSLEQINAIPNEQERGIALSLFQQRQKVAALEKNAIEGAKAARKARVEAVKKKLPKETADQLQKLADGAGFSLGDDGAVKDSFADALAVIESGLKIDVPAILKDPAAAFAVMPHPEEHSGGMSEERRQAVVNEMVKSSGREPVYK